MNANLIRAVFCLVVLFAPPCTAASLRTTTIPDNIGVNIHFVDINVDEHVALLKQAGFGWVRADLPWSTIEAKKGIYNFSRYDKLVSALEEAGIKILFILDYTNPHYDNNLSPYTVEGRQGFLNFVQQAALHFSSKDIAWEIYNEPNWVYWKPSPHVQNYIALAREVTQLLKRTAPHQSIIGPAIACGYSNKDRKAAGYAYLNQVLKDKFLKNMNGVSIHPYMFPKNPEAVYDEIPSLNATLRTHRVTAPLIFSEWGYNNSTHGIDEALQANYAVRSFLIASSLNMPFSILYSWQDAGTDEDDREHNYGVIRHGTPNPDDEDIKKPSYSAIHILTTTFNGYRFDRILHHKNNIYNLRFKKDKQSGFALWSANNSTDTYSYTLPNGVWKITSVTGKETTVISDGKIPTSIILTGAPLLVTQSVD